jgi:hypothetical protein
MSLINKSVLITFICCFHFVGASEINLTYRNQEEGLPLVINYSPKEYDAQGQNWAIIQDRNGYMYFGNTEGCVLKNDCVSWRQIPVSNGSIVRSLAIDHNDVVYVGAQNEIGYLAPDSVGLYRYVSLLSEIDSSYHNFGNVW